MKAVFFIQLIILIPGLYWSCEPEPPVTRGATQLINPLPGTNPNAPKVNYEWSMVVKSVDNFVGDSSNIPFKDILLGNTLSSGISTTNTTYFRIYPDSDKMELFLDHAGWTLWEAHGFYPITWEFKYLRTSHTLEFEGFANIGLSNCVLPEGSTLINRFHFIGGSQDSGPYTGRFVWEETFETGTCVRIEGDMLVYRDFM